MKGARSASRQVLRVGALTTLSRNFQLEFLRPLVGRADVELIVRSGTMRDLLAQLEAHAIDVVLSNSAAPRDARAPFRNHLLNQQPVSLVGRPRPNKPPFRFPEDLRNEPMLLPSLDSDIRVAFDRLLDLAGIRPIILAEVDDMAMLRLLAREREGVTLVPPIVVRDELEDRGAGRALPDPAAHRKLLRDHPEAPVPQPAPSRTASSLTTQHGSATGSVPSRPNFRPIVPWSVPETDSVEEARPVERLRRRRSTAAAHLIPTRSCRAAWRYSRRRRG